MIYESQQKKRVEWGSICKYQQKNVKINIFFVGFLVNLLSLSKIHRKTFFLCKNWHFLCRKYFIYHKTKGCLFKFNIFFLRNVRQKLSRCMFITTFYEYSIFLNVLNELVKNCALIFFVFPVWVEEISLLLSYCWYDFFFCNRVTVTKFKKT